MVRNIQENQHDNHRYIQYTTYILHIDADISDTHSIHNIRGCFNYQSQRRKVFPHVSRLGRIPIRFLLHTFIMVGGGGRDLKEIHHKAWESKAAQTLTTLSTTFNSLTLKTVKLGT